MTLMDSNHLTPTILLSMQICFPLAHSSIDHRTLVFTLLASPNGGPGKLHFFLKSFSEEFRVGSRYKFSETDLNDV